MRKNNLLDINRGIDIQKIIKAYNDETEFPKVENHCSICREPYVVNSVEKIKDNIYKISLYCEHCKEYEYIYFNTETRKKDIVHNYADIEEKIDNSKKERYIFLDNLSSICDFVFLRDIPPEMVVKLHLLICIILAFNKNFKGILMFTLITIIYFVIGGIIESIIGNIKNKFYKLLTSKERNYLYHLNSLNNSMTHTNIDFYNNYIK